MKEKGKQYYLSMVKQKYQWLRGTEVLLWSLAMSLLFFYVLRVFVPPGIISFTLAIMIGCLTALIGIRRLKIFRIQEKELSFYLNRNYPTLKDSADLLLSDDADLSPLQQIQKRNTNQRLGEIYPAIKTPHYIGRATAVLVCSVIVSVALTTFESDPTKPSMVNSPQNSVRNVETKNLRATIRKSTITISPPPYTQIGKKTSADFDLQIEEGSVVHWSIEFDGDVTNPRIILSGKDSLYLFKNQDEFQVKYAFMNPGFYQLAWINGDSSRQYSDYYKIDVVKDQSPEIAIENLDQFSDLRLTDNPRINLKTTLSDDYGLRSAQIIATVSKGSGEAVKFREEKLAFDAPKEIQGKKILATKSIDLVKLGLQPGDELYFYIEASDIKTPFPNVSRTETYFIALQDTSSLETTIDGSLGVDLMPTYFRSQRQIIIDTEKLLKERNKISKQSFNDRSNSLAHDQKVLRLRYGEFLGEEFESSIGPSAHSHENGENIKEEFGHAHDKENKHNLVEEKKQGAQHAHGNAASAQEKKESPLEEFVHAHDSEEEATFFIQSIKTKLKAAITTMWDAELHLRLYEPQKSLPHQYKALKLLKEISHDSRIYVHRTGFDPPPLKEDKRLSGDLSEIQNSTSESSPGIDEVYPGIRKAIGEIEKLLHQDSVTISEETKSILTNAGKVLAQIELNQPGGYLKTLSLLKMVTQHEIPPGEKKNVLLKIRTAFWKVLPHNITNPQAKSATTHTLDLRFLKNLEASKQKNVDDR